MTDSDKSLKNIGDKMRKAGKSLTVGCISIVLIIVIIAIIGTCLGGESDTGKTSPLPTSTPTPAPTAAPTTKPSRELNAIITWDEGQFIIANENDWDWLDVTLYLNDMEYSLHVDTMEAQTILTVGSTQFTTSRGFPFDPFTFAPTTLDIKAHDQSGFAYWHFFEEWILATPQAPPEEPALTSAEQAYSATIANHATVMGDVLTELGKLLQSPNLGSDQWTLQVAGMLATIRAAYNEALEIEPPDSMTHIHYKYVQAMHHYNTMTALLVRGIDETNPALLEQAAGEMEDGTDLILEAARLTNEFIGAHK